MNFSQLKNSFFSMPLFSLSNLLKTGSPFLSFERGIAKGVTQNRRQKRKPPGVKRLDGNCVRRGEKIVKQFFLNFHPGLNVGIDEKNNLYAMTEGRVMMTCEEINPISETLHAQKYYSNKVAPVIYKRFFHVVPFPQGQKFKLTDLV
ncbi:large ribosomal subunit protein bL27 [Parasteatoda tepidariorum]|nr:50S ribosomal protein L27 [Parasteatoda tepidariorum]